MSKEKLLVQEMCDIQNGLLSLNEGNLEEVKELILKCQNREIQEYLVGEALELFQIRPNQEGTYSKLIHQLISSSQIYKELFEPIILNDSEKYKGKFIFNDHNNNILRRLYDYGDITLDQIDFENCSLLRLKYFADIVPAFSKSADLGKRFKITKQLIYDRYYENTIEYAVKYDRINDFIKFVRKPGFRIEKYKTNLGPFQDISSSTHDGPNLANFAAFYGAVNCFKYILLNASLKGMSIDEYYIIRGGNAEIINICERNSLISFSKYALEQAGIKKHKDILDWLITIKNIDYEDLREVDYLPNSAFIEYILNADIHHYSKSALVFYCIERNYPLFVIKYLFEIGAGTEYQFYRGPPFEVKENALDKAIEMKRKDIVEYLKGKGMKPIECDLKEFEKQMKNEK